MPWVYAIPTDAGVLLVYLGDGAYILNRWPGQGGGPRFGITPESKVAPAAAGAPEGSVGGSQRLEPRSGVEYLAVFYWI